MDYTDEQYDLLDRLEGGVIWDLLSDSDRWVLDYLTKENLSMPREDIAYGRYELTEHGKRVLASHRKERKEKQERSEQEAMEREILEQKELLEREISAIEKAREKAQQKAEKRSDRAFQVFLAFLGYILGLITPYIPALFTAVWNGIQTIAKWISSLF